MSRWYRAYSGTVRDDKLAECAIIAGCSRSIVIATWHAILESAADAADGGRFDTTPRRVAALLVEPAAAIEAVFAAMTEVALIGDGTVTAWKKRQYESDNSTERSRRHREQKRNADATLQERSATPPYTDTEADTEKKEEEGKRPRAARSSTPAEKKPSSEELAKRRMIALGVPEDLMADFLRVRAKHNAPFTDTAALGLIREAENAGLTETEAIRMCVERNWRGFRAEFVKDKPQFRIVANGPRY